MYECQTNLRPCLQTTRTNFNQILLIHIHDILCIDFPNVKAILFSSVANVWRKERRNSNDFYHFFTCVDLDDKFFKINSEKFQVSILSTFYACIFHIKVFFLLRVWLWMNFQTITARIKCWWNWRLDLSLTFFYVFPILAFKPTIVFAMN